ncbi:hypothetical protein ES703_116233 [subsurface metagenome]
MVNLTEQAVQMDDDPFGSDDHRHGHKGSSVSRDQGNLNTDEHHNEQQHSQSPKHH